MLVPGVAGGTAPRHIGDLFFRRHLLFLSPFNWSLEGIAFVFFCLSDESMSVEWHMAWHCDERETLGFFSQLLTILTPWISVLLFFFSLFFFPTELGLG